MQANIINFFQELMNKPYESNQVEFKTCKVSCPKLYDTLSSFSNQSSGGHIFLGVDGHAGFKITDVDEIIQGGIHASFSNADCTSVFGCK